MTRIDGPNAVNNNVQIQLNNISDNTKVRGSAFGDGFATVDTGLISTDTRFEWLGEMYNFEAGDILASYNKKDGYGVFNPSDNEYAVMKHLDAVLDKPEANYAEV